MKTFKARLVVKGVYSERGNRLSGNIFASSYTEVYSVLLSIAAHFDYEIWKMDIKTTFLNGNLDECIYMMQPNGFIEKAQEHLVSSLRDPFINSNKYPDLGTFILIKL